MGILDRIAEIEAEMKRTQKNKATEYHLGVLKAKLAKLRSQLIEAANESSGGKGEGFEVQKSGCSRVVMIGFPSVGKSTLLSKVTTTESVSAAYAFTTLTCVPGKLNYRGATIQLLDLPGIIEGASQGKGRGKQVIAVARTADVVLMMLDATKGEKQKELLTKELETCGIRLNTRKPNITLKVKKGGGISFNSTCKLTKVDERMVKLIMHEYKIHNAEILFREDCTQEELIDVIEGNRIYMPCLYCYNKADLVSIEECDRLARLPHSVVISSGLDLGFDYLFEKLWEYLDLIRVYTKRKGAMPDFTEPMVMRKDSSVKDACHAIHRTLVQTFKAALVWGTSTKHNPQRVGINHVLEDEDVLQIIKKN
ncbi:hypothetical protein PTSG_01866 [Salpingoeca rosetta]|uniref:Developmentally-regulated GTP-binding protein 2 n=1 Tax=Salpingoeca rosetta (strain ATCC 50818 / BSB-021) TaxID=946362 RepID=F2TZ66_SALR5|nr:uncharacterized protein PTSG_01866 [Salpingoeca rosetta]EGD78890.1 hypothetical protein PTSG_01866 [Salpingoeca rosetta]|eukprot:XP_004997846.1 hypothetical protein PTSG_01866 [Salpingoeca rosetta]